LLVADRAVADYFEACASHAKRETSNAQVVAHWMTGELFRLMNDTGTAIERVKVRPGDLVGLIEMVSAGRVNQTTAKLVFAEMFETGQSPEAVVERQGLAQVSDAGALAAIVERVLDENPHQVADYMSGKEQIGRWLLGQVMKATRGQANPQVAQQVLQAAVGRRR
jgi:aspartyl-tRNA(Asn)/glutamyl-tRNA(Gln) amidotransferase subunit B